MPELPEVEMVARTLRAEIIGDAIEAVDVRWPRVIDRPRYSDFERRLLGSRVEDIARRGKFVILQLSGQAGYLIIHLRMTGRLLVASDIPLDKHCQVVLDLESGRKLVFRDIRKFGRMYLVDDPLEIVGSLGPEPLDINWSATDLAQALGRHRRQIKPLLLDQHFLAGLGNIYVDESLWLAGIHPLRSSNELSEGEISQLHRAVQQVLGAAIRDGGTTLQDYRNALGQPGRHQHALAVYGRAGMACSRCGGMIERTVVGQRGTHYCPICQRQEGDCGVGGESVSDPCH